MRRAELREHTDFQFTNSRYVGERRCDVMNHITLQLMRFGSDGDKPRSGVAFLSPKLADAIGCHNPVEFTSMILGVTIEFMIDWSLENNKLELTIQ